MILFAFCGLIALCAVVVAGWAVFSGQIQEQGLDALFLILVCLLVAAVFALVPFLAYRKGLLRLRNAKPQPAPEARKKAEASAATQEQL